MPKEAMTKDKTQSGRLDRRHFLTTAGLAIGAAGATAAGSATAAAPPSEAPSTHAGYRETEHVKTYYDTARD